MFVVGTVAAIRLPDKVDSTAGEQSMVLRGDAEPGRRGTRIPASVAFALRANCGPRWMSGFLTMFMAFLLRDNPIEGWRPEVLIGLVIGAAGLGNTLGIFAASHPEEGSTPRSRWWPRCWPTPRWRCCVRCSTGSSRSSCSA